jgi:hypothetical protein
MDEINPLLTFLIETEIVAVNVWSNCQNLR